MRMAHGAAQKDMRISVYHEAFMDWKTFIVAPGRRQLPCRYRAPTTWSSCLTSSQTNTWYQTQNLACRSYLLFTKLSRTAVLFDALLTVITTAAPLLECKALNWAVPVFLFESCTLSNIRTVERNHHANYRFAGSITTRWPTLQCVLLRRHDIWDNSCLASEQIL